jgi:phenylalanyl-tRNA synthetase beta chain
MKASYNWLKSLVPGIPDDPRAVAERFTRAGLEVEGISEYGAASPHVVLAWVVSIRPHPTKSGLRLVTVDRGDATQEVICGAPNVPDPGGVVVLAPLGTHLPAKNLTIGKRDIGGVPSEGMLCSEAELGLSEDGAGILVFPPNFAAPGTKLSEAIPETHDTIFEIGLTPNRPDGLGHLGLAREAAALFDLPWTFPAADAPARTKKGQVGDVVSVQIAEPDRCPHYGAAIVEGAVTAPSPAGARYRLAALGIRAISNFVDVTNVILLEYGHPMHAFDADKLRGGTILVRLARPGEELVTLDGVTRKLDPDDLVIADAEGAIALAGVMGGQSTEITEKTTRILLECAYFDPRTVRRTARRHGLHSESSHRFERGVDHGDTMSALEHASALVVALGGADAAALSAPVLTVAKPLAKATVRLAHAHPAALLGSSVTPAEAQTILERLGCGVLERGSDYTIYSVPTHRPDITRDVDLIDEIARVRGMDDVPAVLPPIRATDAVGGREALGARVRAAAVAVGLSEAIPYAFLAPRALEAVGAPPATVVLKNPLSENQSVMRTSLLPGLLDAVARARRHGESDARLFTIGRVFLAGETSDALPREELAFAAVLAGTRSGHMSKPEPLDLWDLKATAEGLVLRVLGARPRFEPLSGAALPARLHPRAAAALFHGDRRIGTLGQLHPNVIDALDVGGECFVLELELETIAALPAHVPQYRAIPKFPASPRDVSFLVKSTVAIGDIERTVRDAAGDIAEDVRLFDRFVGQGVPEGHVNLAFRVVYRSPERTLTDAEIEARHDAVKAALTAFGATLRA